MATSPVPKKLNVGPHIYQLVVDAGIVEDADATYGLTRSHKQQIAVHPNQASGQMRETVLHEALHAVIADTGAGAYNGADHPLMSKEDEERLVSALSPRLLDLLRRNPKLITYLTGDE